ncbi:MAG: septum formation initiator family protein [Anaerovoracaceae bacterium]
MVKKRRSQEFKNSNKVIDIAQAREERQDKRRKHRTKIKESDSAKKTIRKGIAQNKKKRKALYAIIILGIVVILSVTSYNLVSLKQDEKAVMAEQTALQKEKEKLTRELKQLNDPEYIEEQARAQLKLIMPGETIYVFPEALKNTDGKN